MVYIAQDSCRPGQLRALALGFALKLAAAPEPWPFRCCRRRGRPVTLYRYAATHQPDEASMRNVALCITLLIGGRCIPALAQEPRCVEPRDACAFFNQYLAAFNARDFEAFRATFDDSITVMFDRPAPPQRMDGRAAVEAMFRRVFPPIGAPSRQLPPPIVPAHLRAQDLGDVVVVSFEIIGDDAVSRRTVILHHGANGWRVVHIHGSSGPA